MRRKYRSESAFLRPSAPLRSGHLHEARTALRVAAPLTSLDPRRPCSCASIMIATPTSISSRARKWPSSATAARATPTRSTCATRRPRCGGGAAQGIDVGRQGRKGKPPRLGGRRGREVGRHHHDAHPRRASGRHLPRPPPRQHEGRRGADVRARPQRSLQPDRAPSRHRRADGGPEGSRPHGALGVPARRRRTLPAGDLTRTPPATRTTSAYPTPPRSAAGAPASSRPASGRSARPTSLGSRWFSAAASSNSSRRVTRPWSRQATRPRWPTSSACTR